MTEKKQLNPIRFSGLVILLGAFNFSVGYLVGWFLEEYHGGALTFAGHLIVAPIFFGFFALIGGYSYFIYRLVIHKRRKPNE